MTALLSSRAFADGAFPDSMGILLPLDQPNRIIASTNFGLLVSEDDGTTWSWVCEEAVGVNTFLHQLGAPPNDLMVALSVDGLTYSNDFGCSWHRSNLATAYVDDAFPDAVNPSRVYALIRGSSGMLQISADGAQTFGPPVLTTIGDEHFSGVENARSSPQTVYLTLYTLQPTVHPYIARSTDGGQTWARPFFDPGSTFDSHSVRLAAVDPENANKLYLRLANIATGGESLGIFEASLGTLRIAYSLPAPMSAFLRRSNGQIIVAARDGSAFISADGGATFAAWPNAPHLRALGERNGVLYAVGDNFLDGFAVARSRDQGATWQPLIRFEQLTGPKSCGDLANICAGPWLRLRNTLGLSPDAGAPAAGNDAKPRSGCSQSAVPQGVFSVSALILAIVAVRLMAAGRRDR